MPTAVYRLRSVFFLHVVLLVAAGAAFAFPEDPDPYDYLLGSGIGFPERNDRVRTYPATNANANFTYFGNVSGVEVVDGVLRFDLTADEATLGWGNYQATQTVSEIEGIGQERLYVSMRMRQSCTQSVWTAMLWRDGSRLEATAEKTVSSTNWTDVEFGQLYANGANPDGLEFSISATNTAHVDIEWVKVTQRTYEGYCRTEFVLPTGHVWRAIAHVSGANERHNGGRGEMHNRLHINGQVVDRPKSLYLYHVAGVDIAPYLQAGTNCVGFYSFRIGYQPFQYFQARVIMEDGTFTNVFSGPHWTCTTNAVSGWDQPDFDDSAWSPVDGGTTPYMTYRGTSKRVCIPEYNGRLVMENPSRPDLFYVDTSHVLVDVAIPRGLTNQTPTLHYAFGAAGTNGLTTTSLVSSVSSYLLRDDSAVYRIDAGQQSNGVYTLALSLRDGGTIIEERPREPIVVLRKFNQTEVAGTNYLDGLDLVLEDEIDFTDPADPHPWRESCPPASYYGVPAYDVTTPSVVNRNGMVYREVTYPVRSAGFSYRFEFDHPGSFYVLELEYPDDDKRTAELCVSTKHEKIWTNCQTGYGYETGGRFLNTYRMLKARVLHVADNGPHTFDIINVRTGERAAAKSLKIYRVVGDLPSVGSLTNRFYGIHTERCYYTSGIGMNFGLDEPLTSAMQQEWDADTSLRGRMIKDLLWQMQTGEAYAQYLKFAGQNFLIMGCYQYNDYNTPYIAAPPFNDSSVLHCMKTMLANILDLNDINFMAGIQFSQTYDVRTYANDAEIAKGADTVWMVKRDGTQRYGHSASTMVANWLHPDVQAAYSNILTQVGGTFGHLSHFRGVHGFLILTQYGAYYMPALGEGEAYDDPLVKSYDDITFSLFTNETAVAVPVATNDLDRFEKRADFISTNATAQAQFLAWRCQKVKEFQSTAVDILHEARADLVIANQLATETTEFFQYLYESGRSYADICEDLAVDIDLLNTVDDLWTGRWTISWRSGGRAAQPSQDAYLWLGRTSTNVISAFEDPDKRYVLTRTSWDENVYWTGGYMMEERNDINRLVESDWLMNCNRIRAVPQAGGYNTREALIQGLITADPNMLFAGFTDLTVNTGHEQVLRSVMKIFTHLPYDKFTNVLDTGLDTDFAIRKLLKGNESWFYVVNPCQWHMTGTLALQTDGTVVDLVTSNQVAQGNTNLTIELEPYELQAFHINSSTFDITAYTNDAMDPVELSWLQDIPDAVEEQLEDPGVVTNLTADDYTFTTTTVASVNQAIVDEDYAKAWMLLTEPRFWVMWKWPELRSAARSSYFYWTDASSDGEWSTPANWSIPPFPSEGDRVYLANWCDDAPQVIHLATNATAGYIYLTGQTGHRSYTFTGSNLTLTGSYIYNESTDAQTLKFESSLYEDNANLIFRPSDGTHIEIAGGVHSASYGIMLDALYATSTVCRFTLSGGSTYGGSTSIRGSGGISEIVLAHTNAISPNSTYLNIYEQSSATLLLAADAAVQDYFRVQISNCVMRVYTGNTDRVFECRGYVRGRPSYNGTLTLASAADGGSGNVIFRMKPNGNLAGYLPIVTTTGSVVECDADNGVLSITESTSYGSGVISGPGKLRKTGSNDLAMYVAQEYTGGTEINEGSIQLCSGYGGGLPETGLVVIAGGAVFDLYQRDDTIGGLGGEGSVELDDQTLTVREGLRPGPAGEASGTLTVNEAGTVVLGAASTNVFELGPTNAAADKLVLTDAGGGLTLGGTLSIVNTGGMEVGSYVLADLNGGTLSGSFGVTNLPTGFSGSVDTSSGDVILTITGLPGQYYLDTEAGTGGSVTPGDGWYTPGVEVSVTASPDTGYHFTGWSGDVPAAQATNAEITLTMDRERSLNAGFAINHYTLTASSGAHGSISPSGAIDAVHGSDKSFSMSPHEDYQVSNVVVDSASIGVTNTHTFTNITADHTIHVNFELASPVTLNVVSAQGNPDPGTGSHRYPTNEVITCWMTEGTLYEGTLQTQHVCLGWSGTGSIPASGSNLGTGQRVLSNDSSIAWHWQTNYWLDVDIVDHTVGHRGGTGSVDVVDAWYGAQTNLQLTATEKGGSTFMYWTRDGAWYSDSNPLNVTMASPMTLGANFTNGYPRYYITATCGVHGTMSPSGVVEIAEGFDTNFTITPHAHYHVSDVVMDGLSAGPKTSYSFYNVQADHTLTAEFEKDSYTVQISSSSGGSVTDPGEGGFTYEYDTLVSLAAGPAAQHTFTNWTGTAVDEGKVADEYDPTTTLTMHGNHTVQANFFPHANVIPFEDSFEAFLTGQTVIGTNGWYAQPVAAAAESASATNLLYTFTACDLPLAAETHTNIMCLDMKRSYLTNRIAQAAHTNVSIDMMVRWVRPYHDDLAERKAEIRNYATNTQFAAMVDTNGYLLLFHGEDLGEGYVTNRFTTLTNGVDAIGTSDWVRLTFTLDYLGDETGGRRFFKVQPDGGAPLAHAQGYLDPSDPGAGRGGPWFLCAHAESCNAYLSSINMHGNGLFDDLRVSITNPLAAAYWSVVPSADPGGRITPSSTAMVRNGEDSADFVITNLPGYQVTNVLIDGSILIGPTNVYTFTAVGTNHTIRVMTSAQLVDLTVASSHGVPDPARGTHVYETSNTVTCTLSGSPQTLSSTRYVCTGWTGTGSAPASGASTNTGSFTITNDSTVTWSWQTNVWLDTGTDGHGTVDVSDGWKELGSTVDITAVADEDYVFSAWTGDTAGCTINGAQLSAPMQTARSITATFVLENGRNLTVSSPHGSPEPGVGVHAVPSGTVYTCTLGGSPAYAGTLATQLVCTGWTGSGNVPASGSTTNTGSFTLDQDSSVAWQWQTNVWLDTAVADLTEGGGGGTGSVDVADGWYAGGTNIEATATPEGESSFTYWLLDSEFFAGSYDNPVTFALDRPRDLTAYFTGGTQVFDITATASAHGQIEPSGVVGLMAGSSTSFVMTADEHYFVDDVLIDGSSIGATNSYTFEDIDDDHAIHVGVAPESHALVVSSSDGGAVTVPGEGTFSRDYDSQVSLEATAQARYVFTNWSGTAVDAGKVDDPSAASTFLTMHADYTVQANFDYKGNPIPFSDSFETYADGAPVVGTNGWYGRHSQVAAVSNLTYVFTNCAPPLPEQNHERVLVLDTDGSFLTNRIETVSLTNVTFDLLVRFTACTNPTLDTLVEDQQDAQLAAYINSNGYPVVFHSEALGGGLFTNRLTTLTNGVSPLSPGKWTRLTVTMDYLSDTDTSLTFFKVQINAGDPLTNSLAYLDPADPGAGTGGPWFLCANVETVTPYVRSLEAYGTGALDDLRIDETNAAERIFWTITPSTDPGGKITPSTPQTVLNGDDSPAFVFTNTPGYLVTNVMVDSHQFLGPTNTYTFTNVRTNHSIRVLVREFISGTLFKIW